jgi:hypothetical protein
MIKATENEMTRLIKHLDTFAEKIDAKTYVLNEQGVIDCKIKQVVDQLDAFARLLETDITYYMNHQGIIVSKDDVVIRILTATIDSVLSEMDWMNQEEKGCHLRLV